MVNVLKHFEILTIVYSVYISSTNLVATEVWTTGLKRQNGLRMKDRVLESITGLGYIMCIRECKNRGDCMSLGYNRQGLVCELYWSNVRTESDSSKVLTDALFTYVDMTDVPPSLTPDCVTTTHCGPAKAKCVQLTSKRTVCIDPVIAAVESTTSTTVEPTTSTTVEPTTSTTVEPTTSTTVESTSASTQHVTESMSTVSTETNPSTFSISTSTTSTCPPLYTRSENNKFCILLVQTEMSRDNAKIECQKTTDSSLLLIDSQETQDNVSAFLTNHVNSNFQESELWIDGTYNDKDSEWSSSSGPLTYVNWKSNEKRKGNEDCISFTISNGEWKPTTCNKKKCFLCQIHIS